MGGLLLPMLVRAGYPERTSVGLITVSGSIGVFLPPSLPVILYAFYANVPLEQLFVAGALPGLVLVAAVAGWGAMRASPAARAARRSRGRRSAQRSTRPASRWRCRSCCSARCSAVSRRWWRRPR